MKTLIMWDQYLFFEWEIKNVIGNNPIAIWDRKLSDSEIEAIINS